MTSKEIREVLAIIQDPAASPGALSGVLMKLSAEFTKLTDEFRETLTTKATAWPQLRNESESDKQADKKWDASPEGIMEMGLRLQLKSLEKLMSAIKASLRTKEMEARNLV
jgi:hypothetical protein